MWIDKWIDKADFILQSPIRSTKVARSSIKEMKNRLHLFNSCRPRTPKEKESVKEGIRLTVKMTKEYYPSLHEANCLALIQYK